MHNNIMAVGSRDHPPCLQREDSSMASLTIPAIHATDESLEIAIERLQQGESLNIQDVKTNLFWELENSLLVMQRKWFVPIIKQQHDLDTVSYHKLFDVLKQYQKEVNEIHAERIAKNANPLALVAAAQPHPNPYYQAPKSHKPYAPTSKQSSSTKSNASTKFKGKEIAKPITPPSESASEKDNDPEQAQRDKDMQKNLALIAKYFKKIYKPTNNNLRTFSNSRNKNVDTSLRYKNDHQTGQFRNQRTVTVVGAMEIVGSQVVQQTMIHCFNCKEFGHFAKECMKPKRVKEFTYHKEKMLLCKQAEKGVPLQLYGKDPGEHSEQPESISNTCVVEKVDSNVILDSPDMCDNDIQTDQNAEYECAALANLIVNLKLDVNENKKIQKQLKKANTSLAHELKECKSILAETSRTLRESNNIRDSCLIALQNKQAGLEMYKTLNDRIVDYDKLEHKELVDQAWEKHSHDHFRAPTAHDTKILIKTCLMPLSLKTHNDSFTFVHELKQEMHADLKYLSDLDAHTELQCLYLHKVKECECLAQKLSKQTETVSKEVYTELLRSFAKLENTRFLLNLLYNNVKNN
ncbi:retrovirus-related pol polyprotein from transposon TNT 1-94 [Tanacetum coccineum]